MKNDQKSLTTPILVVVIVILLIVVCYISFRNSTPIVLNSNNLKNTDWKTYTNTQYGFSFQYPPYLKQVSAAMEGDKFVVFLQDSTAANTIRDNVVGKSLEVDYFQKAPMAKSEFVSSVWRHSSTDPYTNITVNNNQAVRYEGTDTLRGASEESTQGYDHWIQVGIWGTQGSFINIVSQSVAKTQAQDQFSDMTWANSISETVQLK